jgi:hypothetical protein
MTNNTPSPAPGLEECVEWLDSLRITDITWSANEFERIREIVHATKHHLQSLRPAQPAPHADDVAVDKFAAAMRSKLARKRAAGRGGWDDPQQCTVEMLARMLVEHVIKGDPTDVGNFAMMLFNRGCDVQLLHEARLWLDAPRPAQPAPTVQRWNPGVTWLNDRAAEPEMFESDIGTFVRWIDHVAALRAASAASATYTQEQLDAAKWRAHELLRGLTLDPPRACPCCANQPPASGLSDFDAAVAAELPRVSDVEYNSHNICKHFAGELRKRLSTRLGKGT